MFHRLKASGRVGYVLRSLSPEEISCKMLRRCAMFGLPGRGRHPCHARARHRIPYNLNAISHDTAIALVRHIQSLGVSVSEVGAARRALRGELGRP